MDDNLRPIDVTQDIQEQIKLHREHKISVGTGVQGCYCAGCMEIQPDFKPKPKTEEDVLQDDSMFTHREEGIFDINIQYRQALLEDIFKDGIPKDNGTRRIVNELLSSVDTALLSRAKIRYGIIANKAEQNTAQDTVSILKSVIQQRMELAHNAPIEVETLPKEYVEKPLNEGALKLGADSVSVKDFFDDKE